MKWGSLLRAYIKRRTKLLLGTLLILLIFGVVCYLYGHPLEPLIYAALICLFFGLLFGAYDFYSFAKKHFALQNILQSIEAHLGTLPAAGNLLESDYQELLHTLYAKNCHLRSSADAREKEMLDYYTLWTHQIKTPLFAMRLLLQSEPLSPRELEQELFKIEEYTQMALYYQRLESLSSDLLLKEIPLSSLIRQAVKKYAGVFIFKKLPLTVEETNETVLTDEKWLVFILEQLLSNALKYTATGSVHIYVNAGKQPALIIEDTGIGIRQEDIPRLFERGFTGYNGRLDKKASGLGLYLCREISQKLSISLSITSEVGRGTKVSLTFPAHTRLLD